MKARSFPRIDRTYTIDGTAVVEKWLFGLLPLRPKRVSLAHSSIYADEGTLRADVRVVGNAKDEFTCKDLLFPGTFFKALIEASQEKSATESRKANATETEPSTTTKAETVASWQTDFTTTDRVWSPPNPSQLGIPQPLAFCFRTTTSLKAGDFVRQGDDLVTFEFTYFAGPRVEGWTRHIVTPKMRTERFILASPVTGLVIDRRHETGRTTRHLYKGLIHNDGRSPVVLVSDANADQFNQEISKAHQFFHRMLHENAHNNWHMDGNKNPDHPDYLHVAMQDGSFWEIGTDAAETDKSIPRMYSKVRRSPSIQKDECMSYLSGQIPVLSEAFLFEQLPYANCRDHRGDRYDSCILQILSDNPALRDKIGHLLPG